MIGLTTYLNRAQLGVWDVRASFLPAVYFQGVTAAGGVALLLPPQPVDAEIADRVLDSLDGLLITGGNDVDPASYGQQPHPSTDKPAQHRDAWEFALLRAALKRQLPVLGICRGAQVLNVALGGTLHQHLPDVIGHSGHRAGNAVFSTLPVRTVPGTQLADLVGESVDARCYHHQAIADLGDGLVVSGWDADGVIEGLELPGKGFVVAVQWHPEESLDDLRLFSAIVEAARAYANEKERHAMTIDLTQRLAGKIAVVTGGGGGIGLASARRLHAEGATVVIADIDERTGTVAAEEVSGLYVPVDVSDEASVNSLFDLVASSYGSVDIAVNNAGISPSDDDLIENTELPAWQRVQDVNLKSVYLCCRAALRHMAPAGRGSIVNIASFVAVMGSATSQISYTASKGGVLAMSRELGVQFARQGIRVNALCPGPVNTPLLQELFANDPERAARRMVHVPMGRFGEADEIAAVVAFLASDDASFITAASYLVDGGISAAYTTPL